MSDKGNDLISRCKLFNALAPVQTLGEAYGVIQGMPTVDAVPVRHGRWVGSDSQCGIACSVCGVAVDDFCCSADYVDMNYQPNFCPNCGAKMDG